MENLLLLAYFLHFKTKLSTQNCLQLLIRCKEGESFEEILPNELKTLWLGLNIHQCQAELQQAMAQGVQFCLMGEAQYPSAFYQVQRPPLVLSYIGTWPTLNTPRLSVVGAREPTRMTLDWLEEHLSPCLFAKNWLTVSGGAVGVDQTVHRLSFRAAKPTMIFLPSGLSQIYPRDLREWRSVIEETGSCLASEYFPLTTMRKHHFHHRNRLIAAMGHLVFVVQGRIKSGTMVTAQRAMEMGRAVATLPAFPSEVAYNGNVELLASGAHLVRDAQDLITTMNLYCH